MSRDPGKRIDSMLYTDEWKAFVLAARGRGIFQRDAVREAILQWVERQP